MSTIKVDREFLLRGKSFNGGWSKKQFKILGEDWPLEKGWWKRIIGIRISEEDAEEFLSLKDKHLAPINIASDKDRCLIEAAKGFKFCPHCGFKLP